MFKKIIVALVGNDGSGKTYQGMKISQQLKKSNFSVKIIHFDHFFLKIPKFTSSSKYFSIEGEESQSIRLFKLLRGNKLFGIIFPVIAYLDFLAYYFIKVIFSLEKVIIFDRYFYDKLIKFYDLGICNHRLFLLILKLIPAPDLTVYFDLPAKESFQRKKEMTIPILEHRRVIYKKIASDFNFFTIDAGQRKEKVFLEILNKLQSFIYKD